MWKDSEGDKGRGTEERKVEEFRGETWKGKEGGGGKEKLGKKGGNIYLKTRFNKAEGIFSEGNILQINLTLNR